jgi:hypothetical protein
MPRSLAGLVILLVTGAASASEPRPLAPIDRNFSVLAPYETMYRYQLAVRDTLLGGETRRSCEAVVTPSFEREWAIHLQAHPREPLAAYQAIPAEVRERATVVLSGTFKRSRTLLRAARDSRYYGNALPEAEVLAIVEP